MPRQIRFARAFTLIELLVVVAILALLATMAIPNMRMAQTRAKVSRVKADLFTIATAVEAYAVEYNKYPLSDSGLACTTCTGGVGGIARCIGLSTPVAYLNIAELRDPYALHADERAWGHAYYINKTHNPNERGVNSYQLYSYGPTKKIPRTVLPFPGTKNDHTMSIMNLHWLINMRDTEYWMVNSQYDATNGVYSIGYIMRQK